MIAICDNTNIFLDICDKLAAKKLNNIRLDQNTLYSLMIAGLYNNNIFTYVSYDQKKLNGCMVLMLAKNYLGDTVLSMVFTWIDAHYPKLHRKFISVAEEKARELKVDSICFQTNRAEKLIDRRLGKYGFKRAFTVYEKKVKDVM